MTSATDRAIAERRLMGLVSGRIGANVNGQWGHALAKEDRSWFDGSPVSRDVHRAFCSWHRRKYGTPAPTVDSMEFEDLPAFLRWAESVDDGSVWRSLDSKVESH